MKNIYANIMILILMTSCSTWQKTKKIPVTADFNQEVNFIPHAEDKPFGSYLAMNLPYEPFAQIRGQLENIMAKKLINRGEAHITVITPPEFSILKTKMTIQEINQIALDANLQKTKYQPLCIGLGEKKINDRLEQTYFVVVSADPLFAIRQKISDLFVSRGGDRLSFKSEVFYPHVTLGFTLKDLHYEDGIIKDATACRFDLKDPTK